MSKAKAQRVARPTLCGLLTPRSPALGVGDLIAVGADEGVR